MDAAVHEMVIKLSNKNYILRALNSVTIDTPKRSFAAATIEAKSLRYSTEKENQLKIYLLSLAALALAVPANAVPNFFDDFEGGVSGSVWTKWTGGSQEILQSSSNHNITPGGSKSARAFEADPTAYNAYADFGAWGGFLAAEVYIYEDFNNKTNDPSRPVTNMLALVGDTGGAVGFGTDYIQLGVVPFYPGGNLTYGFRTRFNDNNGFGIIDTGVARKAGWTKLAIEVDAMSAGGQIRFFIDGQQVGTSTRSGADLRWVRLGNNSKTYENFWYDDVKVVPEPATLLALGAGVVSLAFRRRKV